MISKKGEQRKHLGLTLNKETPMLELLKKKIQEFDARRDRFHYLLGRFELYQSLNSEQAEAYLLRARLHEKKLEEAMAEITRMKERLQHG